MLPAEIAQAVKRIQFVTGRQVSDVMAGAYLSVFKGRGMEFDEVRPYVPGDDVRAIDWNVTARTGEPHVKRFVEERELTVMLLVDVSASQDFGSGRRSKLEAAVELSALLAMSAVENGDKVGMLLFHGGADLYIPPRKGGKHALRIVREVLARGGAEAAGPTKQPWIPPFVRKWFKRFQDASKAHPRRATSIAAALELCRQVLPRRAVLFLISDFMDDGYMQVLRHANRKHDVVAALITDPREAEMPPAGLVTLEDAESGKTRLVDTRSREFRTELASRSKTRQKDLHDSLRATGMDLVVFDASGSMVDPLLKFFRERQREVATMKRALLLVVIVACSHKSVLDESAPVPTEPTKDAIAKHTETGPVKVDVHVWPGKPTLDDPIYLRVDIEAPAGISVDAPFQEAGDQRMGRFRVVGFTQDVQRTPAGGQHRIQTYTLEAPSSGKQRVPPLRMEVVDGHKDSGKAQEILTDEIPLDIAPVKEAAKGAEMKAAAGDLDPDVGGTPWLVILGIASGIAVVGSGTVLALRGMAARRRIADQKSAYDEAIAALRELEGRGAPSDASADAWFVLLSGIVRDYLERRYDIRAPERTTEEFLTEASKARELTSEHRTLLTQFLERCDRVKFAGYRPDAQESIDTLAAARAFVEDTKLALPEAAA